MVLIKLVFWEEELKYVHKINSKGDEQYIYTQTTSTGAFTKDARSWDILCANVPKETLTRGNPLTPMGIFGSYLCYLTTDSVSRKSRKYKKNRASKEKKTLPWIYIHFIKFSLNRKPTRDLTKLLRVLFYQILKRMIPLMFIDYKFTTLYSPYCETISCSHSQLHSAPRYPRPPFILIPYFHGPYDFNSLSQSDCRVGSE